MGHCLWEVSGKVWMSPLVQTNIRLSFDSGSPRHWLFVFSCRQNKLEEALLFSGQFTDALQALTDWLYRVEPQLAEDQPVHGDIDLVLSLIDNHKVKKKNAWEKSDVTLTWFEFSLKNTPFSFHHWFFLITKDERGHKPQKGWTDI